MRAGTKKSKQSGTEKRQRQRCLVIRLADGEYAEVSADAAAAGLTLSSYGRARLVTKAITRAVRRPPADAAKLAQVLAQLGRVGGNVHQLVKHLNFGEFNALRDAPKILAEVDAAVAAIMDALGRPRRADHH